jgi:hypothetical protein
VHYAAAAQIVSGIWLGLRASARDISEGIAFDLQAVLPPFWARARAAGDGKRPRLVSPQTRAGFRRSARNHPIERAVEQARRGAVESARPPDVHRSMGCEGPREKAGRGRGIRRARARGACRDRLPAMRLKHPRSPPDGFLVFDGAAEVGHRFGANVSPRIAM